MTREQFGVLTKALMFAVDVTEAHHGMCVGADAQFHALLRRLDANRQIKIIGHPASNFVSHKRAELECDEVREAKPSLTRNHDIVDECNLLIATPKTQHELLRSGTWSTIRYAKKVNRDYVIVAPSGALDCLFRSETRKFLKGAF